MVNTVWQGGKSYGLAVASLVLALLLTLALEPLQDKQRCLLFFPAIMVCAWYCGMKLTLVAIAISAIAVHIWVLAPHNVWGFTLMEGVQTAAFVVVTGGM